MRVIAQTLLLILAALLPKLTQAACTGTDLRPTLSAAAQAEIAALTAAKPYSVGNHWRATRGDQRVTLLGTMHLFDPRMDAVLARIQDTIETADLVMVEITEAEEQGLLRAVSSDPSVAFLADGPSLIDRTTPEVWAVLSEAAQARGVPPFMAAKYQPWFLSLTLSLPACALNDLREGRTGLDKMVIAAAKSAGVPVVPLESHTTLLDVLATDPIDEQVRFLPLIAQMQAGLEDTTATTVSAYFEEQHSALIAFSRVFGRDQTDLPPAEFESLFDDMMGALLDQRNLAWMERIDARRDPNILIAVGAAHLGGETGLVNQLALRGFTLERLPF